MPGYRNGSETTAGSAFATDILVRSGWRERGDYDDDIAWVKLDRHIGGINGFHTFSYSTDCNHFKNNTFVSHGYPGESPYDGDDMFGGSYTFDKCDVNSSGTWFDYDVRVNAPAFSGQSGSGAVTPASSPQLGGIVWGVASRSDRETRTTFTRLTKGKVVDIAADIHNSTSKGFDLVPQHVRIAPPRIALPSSVQPSRSDALNPIRLTPGGPFDFSFSVFNASYERFWGNVTYSVYLSSNKAISKSDTFLGSFVARDLDLNAKTARFITNRGGIRIPSCRPGGGTNYIGVIVANPDEVTHNNDSSHEEALPVEMLGAPVCP